MQDIGVSSMAGNPHGSRICCDAAKPLESTSFRHPARMENLVEIKDVSFAYGFRPVLKGINMAVPRGKVVSIMGLSGCGKTTLLRLIAGAIKPRKGEVRVAGRVIAAQRVVGVRVEAGVTG